MKKLIFILLAGLSLVAAVSCNKQPIPMEEPAQSVGVPMTLTASLCEPETKLTITEDGNVLKSTWDASEKVSVVTYDKTSGNVKTVDVFTCDDANGLTTANFTGTFHGSTSDGLIVIYPAVENPGSGIFKSASSMLFNVKIGSYWIGVDYWRNKLSQPANSDPSMMKENLLTGVGTISGSNLSVSLTPMFSVLKLMMTLPDEVVVGSKIYGLELTFGGTSPQPQLFMMNGDEASNATNIDGFTMGPGRSNKGRIRLNGTDGFSVPSDRTIVCYVPIFPWPTHDSYFGRTGINSVEMVVSHALAGDGNPAYAFGDYYSGTKSLSMDNVKVEPGKMYRMSFKFLSAGDVGKVIAADGKIYVDAAAATAAGTKAEAMIAYVGKIEGVCANGLAISLTDVYEYNATYAEATGDVIISSWATYHPVSGGTWRLPSEADWQYMMWGYYTETPAAAPVGAIKSVLTGGYYWSSTSVDAENAKVIYYDGTTNASVQSLAKTGTWHVRACLAF